MKLCEKFNQRAEVKNGSLRVSRQSATLIYIMTRMELFRVIQVTVAPDTLAYTYYMPHVVMVASRALAIARKLGLSEEQQQFIEESAMLHDIGMTACHAPDIGCNGDKPYVAHGVEGAAILMRAGLPLHARLVARHVGCGLTDDEVEKNALEPLLEHRPLIPQTIEEEIVTYADLFYSKNEEFLLRPRSIEQAREGVAKFGPWSAAQFDRWVKKFE